MAYKGVFMRIFIQLYFLAAIGALLFAACRPPTLVSVSMPDGTTVTIAGPRKAVPAGVQLTAALLTPEQALALAPKPAGSGYLIGAEFGPAGTVFTEPLTLIFKLQAPVAAGSSLRLYSADNNIWADTGAAVTLGADNRTITTQISHFSAYAVFIAADGGEIHTGTVTLTTRGSQNSDAFFFATETVAPGNLFTGDLWPEMNYVRLGLDVSAIPIAPGTTEAPASGYTTDWFTAAAGDWYAVKLTALNTYGLLAIVSFIDDGYDDQTGPKGRLTFTYQYRPDGGRSFEAMDSNPQ